MRLALPEGVRAATFDALDSTSDEAARRIRAGAAPADGMLAVVASRQTAGRGRLGRAWDSPAGNLHMTLVLPAPAPRSTGELAFVAAVAAGEAVAALLPAGHLAYKWPNDLVCDGRKLGGILVETETDPAGARFAAIGIGVNVIHAPPGLPATSLAAEGAAAEAGALAGAVCAAFLRWHARWQGAGFAPVRANWLAAADGLGAPVTARLATGEAAGLFAGIDETGRLILESGGAARHIAAAEIVRAA